MWCVCYATPEIPEQFQIYTFVRKIKRSSVPFKARSHPEIEMESSENQKIIFKKEKKSNLQTKLILKGCFLLILYTATGSTMAPCLLQLSCAVQSHHYWKNSCSSALTDAFYYALYHADILFPNLTSETHLFFYCFQFSFQQQGF